MMKRAYSVNESEKRRKELLRSAREWYGDSYTPPAVHPRFRNLYGELYDTEEKRSGLQIRIFIGCILFVLFMLMDYFHLEVAKVDSEQVVQMIEADTDVVESWRDLIIK